MAKVIPRRKFKLNNVSPTSGKTHRFKQKTLIDTNDGKGLVEETLRNAKENAQKFVKSNAGKFVDDKTGLFSLAEGFGEAGNQYTGNTASRAAQHAGYFSKNQAGEIDNVNLGKIAGGYFAASAGARVVSGGGLYKDNQGNTNLIGVPLV